MLVLGVGKFSGHELKPNIRKSRSGLVLKKQNSEKSGSNTLKTLLRWLSAKHNRFVTVVNADPLNAFFQDTGTRRLLWCSDTAREVLWLVVGA